MYQDARTLCTTRQQLQKKEIKVSEVVQSCLDNIGKTEPLIRAMLRIREQEAMDMARELDRQGPDKDRPLWGIPMTIKDVICTRGIPTTCGSRILESFTPGYDATLVQRLKQAGAIILGKTNMDEFAMGSSTENSALQKTLNPWDLSRVPGGSSGGSAASMAAAQSLGSIGTDTGGSIRQPASFCGVVGMKPTYGRVSRYGLVAFGSSLDQAGPMTSCVQDSAAILNIISGHDHLDSTSSSTPVPDYLRALDKRKDLQNLRIGLPRQYWEEKMSPEVEAACKKVLETLLEAGAETVPVDLPHVQHGVAAYYIIAMAEASSNLARYDGVRYGYRDQKARELMDMYRRTRSRALGEEVQRRIMIGTYVLSAGYYDAYFKKAAQIRRLIHQDFIKSFESCDLLCSPVVPFTAFGLGENVDDPLQMYLTDIFTTSLNLAGLPGISIPAGTGKETGLPVGIQFMGPAFGEELLLQAAYILEQSLPPLPFPAALRE